MVFDSPMNATDRDDIFVAPSILSADFANLAREVAEAEGGGADWLHVDVMDGHFVPNLTIGPGVVAALREATTLPLDVHLMVEDPARWVDAFARAGATRLTVHVEADVHVHRTVGRIRDAGLGAGVALNPGTPAEAVRPVLGDIDLVLCMTVNPGFGGQSFIASVLPKVQRIRGWIAAEGLPVRIEVDGGIAPDTAPAAVRAGAQVLVAGSAVFGKSDRRAAIEALRRAAAEAFGPGASS